MRIAEALIEREVLEAEEVSMLIRGEELPAKEIFEELAPVQEDAEAGKEADVDGEVVGEPEAKPAESLESDKD